MREHRPITIVSLALFALGWATCFYLTGKSSVCSAADVASSVRGKGWGDLKPIVVDAQPDKDVHITSEWKLFLVGTSTYVNMNERYDLIYTVKDVEALKNRFIQLGVPEKNITVLTSKRHGKWRSEQKNIQEAFENFIANLDSSDYVFVYLSGHGFWFNDDETGYYAPMDLDLNDIRGTCVSIDDMIEALRNSAATFKWMTTDACRNDPCNKSKGREWTFNEATASVYFLDNLDLSDDFVFLQSCSDGQRSLETLLLEQGLLTYALLEALQCEDNPAAPYASGELEFGDLIRYVQMRTDDLAHIHHDHYRYREQTPRVTCGQIPRFTLLTNLRHSDLARSHRQLIEASQNDVELTLHEQETEDCYDNAPLLLSGESETLGSTSRFDSGTPSTLGTSSIKAGELLTLTIAGVKVNFRWIPAGTFLIDSPESEQEPKGDQIQRSVELSQGFWIAETETTQELWQAVTGNNPSYFQESNQAPVDSVSWNDCQDFVEKLNSNYGCILPFGYRYSLPTEAQWEYACRAGTSTLFSFGSTLNGDKANCDGRKPYGTSVQGQSRFETSPVKSYEPNAWGVYDMHGNVREWCASMSSTVEKSKSYNRVLCGGSWRNCAAECQATSRRVKNADLSSYCDGFRLAIVLEPPTQTTKTEDARSAREYPNGDEPEARREGGALKTLTIAGVKVNFHWAPAGTFQMGSPQSEEDCDEEPILLGCTLTKGFFTGTPREKVECDEDETQHEVELTYGFWVAETETTQGFWRAVMGDNPSFFRGSNLLPVDSVSWNDCQVFVDKLNNDYRDTLPNGYIFALPTEAQWEYASRAGESTRLFNNFDSVKTWKANYNWKYMHTERVKSYCPNDWGLYDMLGNVYEWCADWYDKDYYTNATASKDPKGPCSGTTRILRGGSWLCSSRFCRSTDRFDNDPDVRPYDFGFRLVLVPNVGASQTNVADPENGTN